MKTNDNYKRQRFLVMIYLSGLLLLLTLATSQASALVSGTLTFPNGEKVKLTAPAESGERFFDNEEGFNPEAFVAGVDEGVNEFLISGKNILGIAEEGIDLNDGILNVVTEKGKDFGFGNSIQSFTLGYTYGTLFGMKKVVEEQESVLNSATSPRDNIPFEQGQNNDNGFNNDENPAGGFGSSGNTNTSPNPFDDFGLK